MVHYLLCILLAKRSLLEDQNVTDIRVNFSDKLVCRSLSRRLSQWRHAAWRQDSWWYPLSRELL